MAGEPATVRSDLYALGVVLAQAAEREGTSLNGYIISRLQASLGRPAERGPASEATGVPAPSLRRLLIANVIIVGLASVAAILLLLVAWLG
jgi:hypothetical protein